MKEITKFSRINAALRVIQHINEGMTVVDACREVGIARSSYYYIVNRNREYFAEYQQIKREQEIQQLLMLAISETELVQAMIRDALSDETTVRDRVAIMKELDRKMKELITSLEIGIISREYNDSYDFLKQGPATQIQTSHLSS